MATANLLQGITLRYYGSNEKQEMRIAFEKNPHFFNGNKQKCLILKRENIIIEFRKYNS